MTRQRTFALVAAGLLGTAALSACGAEDVRTVGAVAVDGLTPAADSSEAPASPSASAPSAAPSAAGSAAAVTAVQTVQGVLERDDDTDDRDDDRDDDGSDDAEDRYDDFTVNGVEVDFGPSAWVLTAPTLQDYDRDGTAEPLAAELDGLVGQQVTLQVRDDDSDDSSDDSGDRLDDADVYEVNGLALRDLTGPAPWSGGPVPSGALAG